ncbi:MAG TPA: allantoinase AllB [Isosphaeraceae bacterium]
MTSDAWTLRSRRVATPCGIREASILIEGETIASVGPYGDDHGHSRVVDVGDLFVLPGLVDTHVHINDPGRADWEGFDTATAAAAAGGITTLVDMPLNSDPVTTRPAALAAKREAAAGRLRVDCGFYGGLIPGNADQIEPLVDAGVMGFKAFLCHSGIDEFPNVTETDLRAATPVLARLGLPLLVHAELVPPGATGMDPADARSYAAWLASRPAAWEVDAIRLLIGLCRETRCRVHVVHLATGDALPMIAAARAEGLPLTVETCPHYLAFEAEQIGDGDTRFKCAPPIRGAEDRNRLWQGLRDGLIDTIGTDHSPAPAELKRLDTGDLARAWGGIASLQLALPAVWAEARRRAFTLDDVVRWMSRRPAHLVGLECHKGAIAPGFDADFAVFDPDAEFDVEASALHHRHPVTPYEGRTLRGRVVATYLRGREIAREGVIEAEPAGRALVRPSPRLDRLNGLPEPDARAELLSCCGSSRWADRMTALRPFPTAANLLDAAARVWQGLDRGDRLQAFAAHPKIGDVDALRAKFAATAAWASGEQAGVAGASEATLRALAEWNRDYEARFGHIFIVCATGKTADEMLGLLRARLANEAAAELAIAGAEQAKISRIRLRKLLS